MQTLRRGNYDNKPYEDIQTSGDVNRALSALTHDMHFSDISLLTVGHTTAALGRMIANVKMEHALGVPQEIGPDGIRYVRPKK